MNEKIEAKFLILFNPLIMYGCSTEDELRKQFSMAKVLCMFLSIGLTCILGFFFNKLTIAINMGSLSNYLGYAIAIPLSFLFGFFVYNNLFVKRVLTKPSPTQKLHILNVLNNKQDKLLYLFFLLDDSVISIDKKNHVLNAPYDEKSFNILFHTWHKTIYVCVYKN